MIVTTDELALAISLLPAPEEVEASTYETILYAPELHPGDTMAHRLNRSRRILFTKTMSKRGVIGWGLIL